MAHGGAHEPRVAAHRCAIDMLGVARRAQEVGRDHRRHETCDQQREHDRDRDREAELTEILAGDAAHEAHRREDRRDRQRDGDDRKADFVRRLERGAPRRLAHPHMADDVLDLDNRVIDQDAGHQGDREQAHKIEREADRIHRPEGWNDRERQCDGGDEGRAEIAQENKHDDHGKQRALDQRLHCRAIIAEFVVDLGVDLGEGDARMGGLNCRKPLGDRLIDCHVARAFGAGDAECDDRLVEEAGEGARLGRAVDDRSEFVEPDLASARQRDRQRREIGDAMRARERADRLLLAPNLAPSAAEIDVVGADLFVDGRRRDAERQQLFRIERNADFAIHAAKSLDLADAVNALQIARHRIVDQPRELLDAHSRRRSRIRDDRQALDIDAAHDRLVDGARQIAADLGDLVFDVVERAVDID